MEKVERMKRNIVLSSTIDCNSVSSAIQTILAINDDDNDKETQYKDWERTPIKLFINSFGGSVYDGLALIDTIKQSATPVYTICIGSCMSMGLWIWLAGTKRIVGEHSTIMFHDISLWSAGKTEYVVQELKEGLRLQNILIQEIMNKSLIKKSVLTDYIKRKAEWYIPAKEAIELKLADEYYKG